MSCFQAFVDGWVLGLAVGAWEDEVVFVPRGADREPVFGLLATVLAQLVEQLHWQGHRASAGTGFDVLEGPVTPSASWTFRRGVIGFRLCAPVVPTEPLHLTSHVEPVPGEVDVAPLQA